MRQSLTATLVAATIVLLGCSGCGQESQSGVQLVTTNDADGDMSMQAALEGTLTVTDGCLTINSTIVPIFPQSASWDGAVLTWQAKAYKVGDQIMLGGGEVEAASEIPESCSTLQGFLVSQ